MQPYRVCVADDHEDAASVLIEGLKRNHYDAFAVHTGAEAIEACTKGGVDLILLDICFPDIDGYEVCRAIKASEAAKDTVVIFVSVKGAQEDILKGYQVGAVDFITKPYNLPMVMVRVDAAMRTKNIRERLREQEELVDSVYTDQLTGLRNRRFLMERLQEEVEEAFRHDYPVSCVLFDLDEIRAIDDELGPVSLDDLLVELGMALRNYSRTYDVLARFDGTMFAAVLPHTPLDQATSYANKIMREVNGTTFSDPSFPTEVRLMAGVVSCRNGKQFGADFVLGEAMRGLLRAKGMTNNEERVFALNLAETA
ncbi:MAG TPA: diguanylate cyclase [Candidatus Hydrogenedentes bacterium]|nr:diguanylate cyclase [Candidatus Hydrogenedentota bacterium]